MSLLGSQAASANYASRPADERFPSVSALVDAALAEKNLSAEKTYNLKDLRAVADGSEVKLASPKGTATFSHWAFGQLSRTIGAPAAYLRTLPPPIAADAINHGLQTSPIGTSANLLVRAANGHPEPVIRAATSDTYGRVWDASLYGELNRQILQTDQRWSTPPTWTGEPAGAYRGDRDSFVIVVNGGSIVSDPSLLNSPSARRAALGGGTSSPQDGMYRGILIRNSEVGASSVTIETILFRFICGNHLLWGAMMDRQFRRRHVGSHVLRDVMREISKIAVAWSQASAQRDEAIIKSLIQYEIATTREAVIDELRSVGLTKEQAESAYVLCEQEESASPRSYWGASQGVTRLSQATPFQDERYTLDRLAGQILARGVSRVKVGA